MKLEVGLPNNPFSIMYTVFEFSISSIEHGNGKINHIYLEKLECVTKKTNDVTHNANFERVILIYVTDITL